jgi:hypothetical protein
MAAVEPSGRSSEPAAGSAPDRDPAVDADERADRMLADPRGYFARTRERARADIARDIECEIRRLRSP